MMNIVLIGYRCSGKTTVGKIIAHELGREFLDTDALIEAREGHSLEEIISGSGWEHFRNIEKRLIGEVSRRDDLVIATGGGVVLDWENIINLEKKGLIVWLKGSLDVIKARMVQEEKAGKHRPSLTGANPLKEIREILTIRTPLYKEAAALVVDTTAISQQEAGTRIMRALSNLDKQEN